VQSNTVVGPGGDDAGLRIKGSRRGLALPVDSNPRLCLLDPYRGMVATVCEAARNLACTGARPAGITNCLNYGNPERPEVMWQFLRGIEGLRAAALALEVPVISGNVSFYNETEGRAIPPTPTIAMVGTLDDVARHLPNHFGQVGEVILLVRTAAPSLAGSEYEALFGVGAEAEPPSIDLARERGLLHGLIEAAAKGLISSSHDVSDGGLIVALAEACFGGPQLFGAEISAIGNTHAEAFGEAPSTVIVTAAAADVAAVGALFAPLEVRTVGRVTASPRLTLPELRLDQDVAALYRLYEEALPRRLAIR
jgi:phosphoribosylformylglycinamidine synthase